MVGALLPGDHVQSIFPEQNFLQAKLKLIGGLANDVGCIPDMLQKVSGQAH